MGTQNLVDAARAAGVRRILYAGAQVVNTGAYARTKEQAEQIIARSGLAVTVVKPYGPGQRGLFAGIVRLVQRLPVIPVIGSGAYPMRPVYIGDVVTATVACIENPAVSEGKMYYLSGPITLAFRDFLALITAALDLHRRQVRVMAVRLARLPGLLFRFAQREKELLTKDFDAASLLLLAAAAARITTDTI